MHPRRSATIAAGALLLAAPVLSSCGFDYQTDKVNTISAGVNNRAGAVDVLGGVVIAGQPDAGVFVASLANNDNDDADALVSLGGGDAGQLATISEIDPITVPPGGAVSLIKEGGIAVQGSFGAGDFVTVTLGFDSGQTTTLDVAVVRPCYQYADKVDQPAPSSPAAEDGSAYSCTIASPGPEGDQPEPIQ